MDEYTNAGFNYKKVAAKKGWVLYRGTRDSYSIYELVRIINGKFPKDEDWGTKAFTFLSMEDGLRAMKTLTEKGAP